MIPGQAQQFFEAAAAQADGGFKIDRSLRLNVADTPELTRTPSGAGNTKTFTISFWAKRCLLGSTQMIIQTGNTYSNLFRAYWTGTDTFRFHQYNGSYVMDYTTSAVYRDPSAWYHYVIALDTTQAAAADRVKLYVNGVEVTDFSATTDPAQDLTTGWNAAIVQRIGREYTTTYGNYYNYGGYITEFHNVDGQQLAPTDFGEFDLNNFWQAKQYDGTYGTNGFYLKFADNSSSAALGTDSSGNGNTWTPTNFSVAAGAGNDSLIDSPTNYTAGSGNNGGNYATINPLSTSSTLANGNLQLTTNSGLHFSTIGVSSGKWYAEWSATSAGGSQMVGISKGLASGSYLGSNSDGFGYYGSNGQKYNGSGVSYGATYGSGDVIGVALNLDDGNIVFYKNGTSQGTAFTGLASGTYFFAGGESSMTGNWNFGQRPFVHTLPTDHVSLCTTNLANPTITDGTTAFATKLYTGNGGTQTITGLNLSPDFTWIKNRVTTDPNILIDTVRGAGKFLQSQATTAETDNSDTATAFSAFTSDGFTVGYNANWSTNTNTNTFVSWNWDAGSSTVTNDDGSITSSVRANTSAGFSIVSYNGDNNAGDTVGHGLNATCEWILIKNRDDAFTWYVYHSAVGATKYLRLDTSNAETTGSGAFNNTAPTSSVFSLGQDNAVNDGSKEYIAYCWAPVEGYSAFGKYTGNGSADGPFVYTGMLVSWVLIKRSDGGSENWTLWDTARNEFNVMGKQLYPNLSSAEADAGTNSAYGILDCVSNGFKIRGSHTSFNVNAGEFIYAAFAEHPFKTARAR